MQEYLYLDDAAIESLWSQRAEMVPGEVRENSETSTGSGYSLSPKIALGHFLAKFDIGGKWERTKGGRKSKEVSYVYAVENKLFQVQYSLDQAGRLVRSIESGSDHARTKGQVFCKVRAHFRIDPWTITDEWVHEANRLGRLIFRVDGHEAIRMSFDLKKTRGCTPEGTISVGSHLHHIAGGKLGHLSLDVFGCFHDPYYIKPFAAHYA